MSEVYHPPIFKDKTYDIWINEVSYWDRITSLSKRKRGLALALKSLPEGTKIREIVFSELGFEQLEIENGVEVLTEFMNKIYLKDDLQTSRENFTDFIRYKKQASDSMEEYIAESDRKYKKCAKDGFKMDNGAKGFFLLENAQLTHHGQQLALTGVKYEEKEKIHEQMSASMIKFFGKASMTTSSNQPVKLSSEDALYNTNAYSRNRSVRGNYNGNNSRGSYNSGYQNRSRDGKPFNSNKFYNGRPTKCTVCQSIFHYAKNCPDLEEAYAIEQHDDDSSNNKDPNEKLEYCNYVSNDFAKEARKVLREAIVNDPLVDLYEDLMQEESDEEDRVTY